VKVVVAGLGKLGLPMAAVFAESGHEVVGVDPVPSVVDALNDGRVLIEEPGLPEMIAANKDRIRATTEYAEALPGADMTFIIVPTPSGDDGAFINDYVVAALEQIGAVLRDNAQPHLVAVTSTVMPGATDAVLSPAFEQALGRPLGDGVSLCYSPEFIALGSVIRDLKNPDFVLIGADDEASGRRLADFYLGIGGGRDVPVQIMNWANAELAKISVNSFVTMKITYANMLASICEGLPGGDVDVVTQAIGLDSRIGRRYLKGGPPFGGPCFPRDNRALGVAAETVGAPWDLAAATDRMNDGLAERIAGLVAEATSHDDVVAVLGLAYKDNTPVVEESAGAKVAAALAALGRSVIVHDPIADATHSPILAGVEFTQAADVSSAVGSARAVVVVGDDSAYDSLASLVPTETPVTVIDCWRRLARASWPASVAYRPVGSHPYPSSEVVA
jgi:UDPglucose 6-dehydrogenase